MKKIVLISCAKGKADQAAAARDLYQSQLFTAQRTWAEQNSDSWFILSARFGLVDPALVIEPYELTLNGMDQAQRAAWAGRVAATLWPILHPRAHVTILAGRAYREHLVPLLEGLGHPVEVPMQGLGIGQQLGWLKKHTHIV